MQHLNNPREMIPKRVAKLHRCCIDAGKSGRLAAKQDLEDMAIVILYRRMGDRWSLVVSDTTKEPMTGVNYIS